jgi:hypothetical protein
MTGPVSRRSDCIACYADIEADEPTISHRPCSNTFHRSCLDDWIRISREANQVTQATCPLCRGPITVAIAVPVPAPLTDQDMAAFFRRQSQRQWESTLNIWRQQVPQPAAVRIITEAMPQPPARVEIGSWQIVPDLAELRRRVGQNVMRVNPLGADMTHIVHQPGRLRFSPRHRRTIQGLSVQNARSWRRFCFPHSGTNYLVPGPRLSREDFRIAREMPPPPEALIFRVIGSHDALRALWGLRNIAPRNFVARTRDFNWQSTRQAPNRWEEGHWDTIVWHRMQGVTDFRAYRVNGSPFVYFIPRLPGLTDIGLGNPL